MKLLVFNQSTRGERDIQTDFLPLLDIVSNNGLSRISP